MFFPPKKFILWWQQNASILKAKFFKQNKTKQSLQFLLLLWVWWAWSPDTKLFLLFFSSSIYYTEHVTKFTAMNDGQKSCLSQVNFQAATETSGKRIFISFITWFWIINQMCAVSNIPYNQNKLENNVLWVTRRRESSALFMASAQKWIIHTYSGTFPFIHFLSAFVFFRLYSPPHREEVGRVLKWVMYINVRHPNPLSSLSSAFCLLYV